MIDESCGFCAEIQGLDTDNNLLKKIIMPKLGLADRILLETHDFIVIPTLGAFVPGYVMIVSKNHYSCIGKIPVDNIQNLESICLLVKTTVEKQYGMNTVCFEHGSVSCSNKFGGCIDHAHLHIVPCPDSLVAEIAGFGFNIHSIEGLSALQKYGESNTPYLYFQDVNRERYVITEKWVVSQFFRQLISRHFGVQDKWDWRQYLFLDNLQKTIEDVKGVFLDVQKI